VKSCKLLIGVVSVVAAMGALAERVPPGTDEEIRERLQPFGELCRSGEPCAAGSGDSAGASAAMSGTEVYNQFCGICHAAGVADAPVLGNTAAWEPRLAKGMDTLWQHTVNGLNAMPPRGTCMSCSDEELRAALDYMVEEAQ
jgi:cytochrome c5